MRETFYDVHKAITIAKNVVGMDVLKNAVKTYVEPCGFTIENESDTKLIVKAMSDNTEGSSTITTPVLDAIRSCFSDFGSTITEVLREEGYPDSFMYTINGNLIHSFFVVPLSTYDAYEIIL